jgi:hypothetical protein
LRIKGMVRQRGDPEGFLPVPASGGGDAGAVIKR